jgi:hypothetical protein
MVMPALARDTSREEWKLSYWRYRVACRRLRFARLVDGIVYIPGTDEVIQLLRSERA